MRLRVGSSSESLAGRFTYEVPPRLGRRDSVRASSSPRGEMVATSRTQRPDLILRVPPPEGVPDYSKPGSDGPLPDRVSWDVESELKKLEPACFKWYGIEVKVHQAVWRCRGFNYRALYQRAMGIGGDLVERAVECPNNCTAKQAIVVERWWECERHWALWHFIPVPVHRVTATVRWAVICHDERKALPGLHTDQEPTDAEFAGPRERQQVEGPPSLDYLVEEDHGFRGPPQSLPLPCKRQTTLCFTYFEDVSSARPPEDFRPMVIRAISSAKQYGDALWCDSPCWPMPQVGILREVWDWSDDGTVQVTLYVVFDCKPIDEWGLPDSGE
jgi:hypothetical protein